MNELNPTSHSPILGWAYDGHPIYGCYGFADAENVSPYNSYTLMITSYRVKQSRDALLSGLTDPMGTYIEDYEYVEGLGTLDRYNGRYCVTPEYPNGTYAYFCTIKGVAGEPVFPYFIGPVSTQKRMKSTGMEMDFKRILPKMQQGIKHHISVPIIL